LYEVTTFVAWTIVATYLVIGVVSRLRFLGAFASPVLFAMGVFALMPKLDPPHGPKPDFSGAALSLHAALILLAYGAFGLSCVAALMYLSQEHDLKFHKARALFSLLPPIGRLEAVITRLLIGGFALLTVGLFVGAVWLKPPPGAPFFGDWKVMWSALVWALYLALLVSHWRRLQGGRRFAWGAVGGFAFILLTFWGSNLLSNIHNP
ncbi:MAG: cytochrome c biogenesis protein CcsA, partial [Verrucomicrobia bacterium]|nr:cytochrome c biogenesis protein CcsA [Verrucomicrobiota bacterium]